MDALTFVIFYCYLIIGVSCFICSIIIFKIFLNNRKFKYSWLIGLLSLSIFLASIDRFMDIYKIRQIRNIVIIVITILIYILAVGLLVNYKNFQFLTRTEYRKIINNLRDQIIREETLTKQLLTVNKELINRIKIMESIHTEKDWIIEQEETIRQLKSLLKDRT